jgi:hypothetical protein
MKISHNGSIAGVSKAVASAVIDPKADPGMTPAHLAAVQGLIASAIGALDTSKFNGVTVQATFTVIAGQQMSVANLLVNGSSLDL